jgi:hypothetical protein
VEAGGLAVPPGPAVVVLRVGEWCTMPYSWSLTGRGGEVVQKMVDRDATPIAVPAGEYDLRVQPIQFRTQEITVLSRVGLKGGEVNALELNTGLDVQPSEKADPPAEITYTPEGDEKPVQRWDEAPWGPQVLPAGKYRISILPRRFESQAVTWPTVVEVKAGELAKLTLDSGIRITLAQGLKPNFSYQIIRDGQVAQHGKQRSGIVWLPPGTYAVQVRPRDFTPWQTLAENVVVEAGRIVEVKLTELPK